LRANGIVTSRVERGTGGDLEEFVARFIGFEPALNVDNGNGRDRGEQTGLIPEKTSSTNHDRSGCEKGTHNISIVLKAS